MSSSKSGAPQAHHSEINGVEKMTKEAHESVDQEEEKKQDSPRYPPYIPLTLRILISVALVLGILGLIKGYERKGALTRLQKYTFNTVNILLSTLLALNITVTYANTLKLIREAIKYKCHPPGKRWNCKGDIVVATDGRPHGKWGIASAGFIIFWIFFNLGVTVAVALLGLTYSLEEGAIGRSPGSVGVANLTYCHKDGTQEGPKHTLLDLYNCKSLADASALGASAPFYDGSDLQYGYKFEELDDGWKYYFRENSAKDSNIIVSTKRHITTTAECKTRKLDSFEDHGPQGCNLVYYDEEKQQRVSIQKLGFSYMSMNYYFPLGPGQRLLPCPEDPRCGQLLVLEYPLGMKNGKISPDDLYFYTCTSQVKQISLSETQIIQDVPDRTALMAAASLAFSGSNTVPAYNNETHIMLSSYYGMGVGWGEEANGNETKMAKQISKATAGVFAVMDQVNGRHNVSGSEPWRGVNLEVKWDKLILSNTGLRMLVLAISSAPGRNRSYTRRCSGPLDSVSQTIRFFPTTP
ncbi:hypothetical protein BDZ91DRAFT_767854 [Kalaharituber pfeilii]|nr:hypothetical protein BDZ91DRAFT_767854 [Kalaharituber pfeilii]